MRGLFFKVFAVLLGVAIGCSGLSAQTDAFDHNFPSGSRLDDVTDTLRQDNGTLGFAFTYPDVYGDNFRNERFRAVAGGTLAGTLIAFGTRGFRSLTTGSPDLVLMIWQSGPDSFPMNPPLVQDTIPFSSYSSSVFMLDSAWRGASSQFVYIDLSSYGVQIPDTGWFHVGYTAICEAGDTLAILADNAGNSNRSLEYYNGHWVLMREGWRGVNFMIRPLISHPSGTSVLHADGTVEEFTLHPAYPNPFNPQTTVSFDLAAPNVVTIQVVDILGRERLQLGSSSYAAGRHSIMLDGSEWSSGTYLLRLRAGSQSLSQKIVLEK